MFWNLFRTARSVPPLAPPAPEVGHCYFPRAPLEAEVRKRLARHDSLVLYGPARQGKTMLLAACLPIRDCIYIECRPDFKRPHIYRLILASLGYSITTGGKRSRKADYSIKLGVLGTNMEGGVDLAQERTLQEINVDLKNPSEVAHLISRIPRLPYVVLNGFHLLNPNTRENLLFDLAFFSERSQIRFVIIGTWHQADYLEAIEPAIAGKLHYIRVPFWSTEELHEVYRFWCEKTAIRPLPSGILDEMISLAGGDIALFAALMAMPPAATIEESHKHAVELVVRRSLRGLAARIEELLNRRELAFSYRAIAVDTRFEPNPDFQPTPGAREADYQRVVINPETGRPFADGREVKLDAAGNLQYREMTDAILTTFTARIGDFLIYEFYDAAQANRDTLVLTDLVAKLKRVWLRNAVGIDDAGLRAVFLRIDEAQRRAPVSPALVETTEDGQALRIADRRFYLTLRSMGPDEFDEWFEKHRPAGTPRPRRRANVSADVPQWELDRLTEQARQAALAAAGGGPAPGAGARPASQFAQRDGARRSLRVSHQAF